MPASREISKIASYSGADEIKKSDIDAVTEPVLDAVVFQMTDQLTQGNYAGALQKLQQLLKMQEEPIMILGAIGMHFRRFLNMYRIEQAGQQLLYSAGSITGMI
mgnify:CR=1 FL=1